MAKRTTAHASCRLVAVLFVVMGCALVLGACGSSSKPSSTSSSSGESAGITFADCMRSHGVPNFPDPIAVPRAMMESPAFKQAAAECASPGEAARARSRRSRFPASRSRARPVAHRWPGRHDEAMRAAGLRDHCLSFPGAVETFPFGSRTSVFKVAGKMFALSPLAQNPLAVSLKCEPLIAAQLREAHPAVLPGYHLNKRHWNTVTIDGSLPEQMIKDMVEDSYDLIVSDLPAYRRQELGWRAEER